MMGELGRKLDIGGLKPSVDAVCVVLEELLGVGTKSEIVRLGSIGEAESNEEGVLPRAGEPHHL